MSNVIDLIDYLPPSPSTAMPAAAEFANALTSGAAWNSWMAEAWADLKDAVDRVSQQAA